MLGEIDRGEAALANLLAPLELAYDFIRLDLCWWLGLLGWRSSGRHPCRHDGGVTARSHSLVGTSSWFPQAQL